MKLSGLLALGRELPAVRDLCNAMAAGRPPSMPLGIYHAARPYLVATLAECLNAPLVVLTARSSRARQWVDELRTWLPDEVPVHSFADPDALPFERIPWAPETRQRRLESLTGLIDAGAGTAVGSFRVVVASARALIQKTLPVREMHASLRPLRQGQSFDLNKMLTTWVGLGYESASVVETPGEFSRRGGIVDVWPPNLRRPMRVELFGDEVDSLRWFDPSTQRSMGRVERALVGPASEALPRLGGRMADRLRELDLSFCHPPARAEYEQEIGQLLGGSGFRNLEWYLPYLFSQPASLIDYLPETGFLLLDDGGELFAALTDLEGQAEQLMRDLAAAGDIPGNLASPHFAATTVREQLPAGRTLVLGSTNLDGWSAPPYGEAEDLADLFVAGPRYGGQVRTAISEVNRVLGQRQRAVVVSRQAPRLADLWRDAGHAVAPVQGMPDAPPPGLTLVQGVMDEGWLLRDAVDGGTGSSTATISPSTTQSLSDHSIGALGTFGGVQDSLLSRSELSPVAGLWFLTDAELFGWGKPRARRPQRPRAVSPEVFFADVQTGDFVVHIEHGIGLFQGLVKMVLDQTEREYLQVDYAQGDRLLVPVHQADRLARYVGAGEMGPALHRLGTSEWEQVKARARRAVAEIADDLLELYAQREVVHGHAFSPDAPWQSELEASFPYMETEDQLVAIEAVKHDMEQGRPMDRLICGDVGYGKTEVALRASFKAIMDGKQVAILVPTTVLAQQHHTNFSRRLAAFPVSISMLSRFQTPAQQDQILSGLATGKVDLVVGTHRLLSKDVAFKDLGLLIVDEEQRFGVAHKERIKQMRTEVDVLTLTATPIPRTLHMSLTGVRDLSTIETPPEDRLPIKTFVGEFDEALIRQAILRELDRNGQVYFVHNRVQGIEQVASRVQRIVPEARTAIGHGQMPERELSSVMLAFAEGQYDILVCTSIIESGLDIPNANTIVINRADQFGLAQLYQLRGRVGRSAVRAYAYLLVDKFKTLTEDARRRLEAIQEASELGAGFRIAMQDLEIRGAGELLGARQHGHIVAVGFDLYTRLLAQAVQEARDRFYASAPPGPGPDGQAGSTRRNLLEDPLAPTVTLELGLPARIPETYVPDMPLRLQLYRRLAGLVSTDAVDEIAQEFVDRFGPVPESLQNLLFTVRVKVLSINAGVEAIGQEEGQFLIKCSRLEDLRQPAARLQEQLQAQGVPARVARRGIWLPLRPDDLWRSDLLKTLEALPATPRLWPPDGESSA